MNCWRARAPASQQGQRSFQIKLAGQPCGRQAKFSCANLCLLAGPGASERRKARIINCWRAQAPASKQGQRSVQIKLAGRPGGRQVKFSYASLCRPGASERRKAQIMNCWRARAPASQQGQRSFQIKLAGQPCGRQAKFSCANLCLLAGPGASERRKARIINCWRAQAPASKQGQRSAKIKLAGRPGGRQVKFSYASLCLLAGPGTSERRKAQISNCWRAPAPGSKQGQRSFQIKLAGRRGGRQAKFSYANLCLLADPGASERRKAQIRNCWRAPAPAGQKKTTSNHCVRAQAGLGCLASRL